MAVNTPTKLEGEGAGMAADLKYVVQSARDIAKYSNSDKIVVEKSTLPVRTAEKIKEIWTKITKKIILKFYQIQNFWQKGQQFKIYSNLIEFLLEQMKQKRETMQRKL